MRSTRRPRYPLSAVTAAFADVRRLNWTMSAALGADDLGWRSRRSSMSSPDWVNRDFDKSMPSEIDPAVWQDVYKPTQGGRELYVKFTVDAQGKLLLISFKGNRS
jgi:Motility quorum-sensing regulator, toxin of MqsA